MRITLPSGLAVEVTVPADDFPKLIEESEAREAEAHDDVKALKKMAKTMGSWPVATEEKTA